LIAGSLILGAGVSQYLEQLYGKLTALDKPSKARKYQEA
jgi:hypothetical protein